MGIVNVNKEIRENVKGFFVKLYLGDALWRPILDMLDFNVLEGKD